MTGAEITCRELVELVTEYLDDTMPADERARFDAHLTGCRGCQNYLDQMRLTAATVGQLREESVPADARDALLAAFRGWQKSDA